MRDALSSLGRLDLTNPQENVRVGRFMNPQKTFAIEFSLDHSKWQINGWTTGVEAGLLF